MIASGLFEEAAHDSLIYVSVSVAPSNLHSRLLSGCAVLPREELDAAPAGDANIWAEGDKLKFFDDKCAANNTSREELDATSIGAARSYAGPDLKLVAAKFALSGEAHAECVLKIAPMIASGLFEEAAHDLLIYYPVSVATSNLHTRLLSGRAVLTREELDAAPAGDANIGVEGGVSVATKFTHETAIRVCYSSKGGT
jgi:hypothetical protein